MSREVGSVWDEQTFSVSRTDRDRDVEKGEIGEETDSKMTARGHWTENAVVDPQHSNVDPDEEAARNRNTLLSYFNDIASIPTLKKEEEVMLAKEMEAATFETTSGRPGSFIMSYVRTVPSATTSVTALRIRFALSLSFT